MSKSTDHLANKFNSGETLTTAISATEIHSLQAISAMTDTESFCDQLILFTFFSSNVE